MILRVKPLFATARRRLRRPAPPRDSPTVLSSSRARTCRRLCARRRLFPRRRQLLFVFLLRASSSAPRSSRDMSSSFSVLQRRDLSGTGFFQPRFTSSVSRFRALPPSSTSSSAAARRKPFFAAFSAAASRCSLRLRLLPLADARHAPRPPRRRVASPCCSGAPARWRRALGDAELRVERPCAAWRRRAARRGWRRRGASSRLDDILPLRLDIRARRGAAVLRGAVSETSTPPEPRRPRAQAPLSYPQPFSSRARWLSSIRARAPRRARVLLKRHRRGSRRRGALQLLLPQFICSLCAASFSMPLCGGVDVRPTRRRRALPSPSSIAAAHQPPTDLGKPLHVRLGFLLLAPRLCSGLRVRYLRLDVPQVLPHRVHAVLVLLGVVLQLLQNTLLLADPQIQLAVLRVGAGRKDEGVGVELARGDVPAVGGLRAFGSGPRSARVSSGGRCRAAAPTSAASPA